MNQEIWKSIDDAQWNIILRKKVLFDSQRKYRYVLMRSWDDSKPSIAFLMLNPSIADEIKDDPTIRRVIGFAKKWGYGAVFIINLFALRSTDPSLLKTESDPIGPQNDYFIYLISQNVAYVIAGWGTNGTYLNRDEYVTERLRKSRKLYCLEYTKEGHPRHPLYVKGDVEPEPYGWKCQNKYGVIIPHKSILAYFEDKK